MYKCENCKVDKKIGDDVYLVESAFMNRFMPTCSKECAEEIKQIEIKMLQDKIDKIKNNKILKEIW